MPPLPSMQPRPKPLAQHGHPYGNRRNFDAVVPLPILTCIYLNEKCAQPAAMNSYMCKALIFTKKKQKKKMVGVSCEIMITTPGLKGFLEDSHTEFR